MSLVHASKLTFSVKQYDNIKVHNGWIPRMLTIPSEYCWVQTYVTYSYYTDKLYLLIKNMGMVLSKLRHDGKPRPYKRNTNIRLFK